MKFLIHGLRLLLVAVFLPASLLLAQKRDKTGRPNIVVLMADDLDSRQLSCYGGKNLKTRHLDRLASEGLKFHNLIASEAMCVPTRASLFTGLYPARHGAYQNHKAVYDTLKSVGHYLADRGYTVALTGKNHVTKPKTIFPFEIIGGFEPNCVSATDDYDLAEIRTFIKRQQSPFCLFVMSINPHAPWTVGNPDEFDPDRLILPGHWVDTPETRRAFQRYLAEVRRLDDQVGDVLNLLKETGQEENTIFIFLGEQGAQFPGAKWTLYDAGQRSSMIVRWPGVVKPGTETNAIVQYEDITPTFVDIAGGDPVPYLDGASFLKVLTGKTRKAREVAYGIHNNIPEGPPYPIRSVRGERYKLILNLTPDHSYEIKYLTNRKNVKYWDTWYSEGERSAEARKLSERIVSRPAAELYDLRKDPFELNNLAGQKQFRKRVARYSGRLYAWMLQQGDTGSDMDVPFANRP